MPHSSGGGGFRGSFHGGTGHVFHSSHTGTRNASYKSRAYSPKARISNTPFDGGNKYMYYRSKKPAYFYADYLPRSVYHISWKATLVCLLIIDILFYVVGFCFGNIYHNPVKLNTNTDEHYIIEDDLGLLGDGREDLENELENFYQKTGIVPAIITFDIMDMYNAVDGKSVEQYTLNQYQKHFDDESHWLIAYGTLSSQSGAFRFEGIQGNDTDEILNNQITSEFNRNLEYFLQNAGNYSAAVCLRNAFESIEPDLMKSGITIRPFISVTVVVIAITCVLGSVIIGAMKEDKFKKSVLVKGSTTECHCEFCGGTYVREIDSICPFCKDTEL